MGGGISWVMQVRVRVREMEKVVVVVVVREVDRLTNALYRV